MKCLKYLIIRNCFLSATGINNFDFVSATTLPDVDALQKTITLDDGIGETAIPDFDVIGATTTFDSDNSGEIMLPDFEALYQELEVIPTGKRKAKRVNQKTSSLSTPSGRKKVQGANETTSFRATPSGKKKEHLRT